MGRQATAERLRQVTDRAVRTAEAERRRAARALREEAAQALVLVLVRLRALAAEPALEAQGAALAAVRAELEAVTERLRQVADELHPTALESLGLEAALAARLRRVGEAGGPVVEFRSTVGRGALTPEAALAAFRIVEEAVANALVHGRPGRVRVGLHGRADAVVVTVEDDGAGFPVEAVLADPRTGAGLYDMVERAAYIGGRVTVRSEPGAGTHVQVEIPVAGRGVADDDG